MSRVCVCQVIECGIRLALVVSIYHHILLLSKKHSNMSRTSSYLVNDHLSNGLFQRFRQMIVETDLALEESCDFEGYVSLM